MKVFVARFTMFSGAYWKNVDYKIIALSMEELKTAVHKELEWMNEDIEADEKWGRIKSTIVETELTFPLVESRVWDK